ncbi:MAG: RidA family protein [Erysipelotrichaceae bacterium]
MIGDNTVLARNTENAPISSIASQTVAFSHYNNLSAQLPIDPKTGKLVSGGVIAQAEQCFNNIKAIVESIDHVMSDVVRITIFVSNIKDMDKVNEVYKTFFPTYVPAQTIVCVAALPMDALLQVEALLTCGEGTIPNAPQAGDLIKLTNNTTNAPTSVLSSQSVAFSHYNNLTAQLPIDPKTGRLVEGGVKEQTAQCLKNIKAILESIDVPFDDIVKVTIFVNDLGNMESVNEVYTTFFPDSAIAPQTVEARHGLIIEANDTKNAPLDCLAAQSVAFSHYNNIGAQLPIDPKTGNTVVGIKAQVEQCLNNIKAIIESVDHVISDVVKINVYLTNLEDTSALDEVYKTFFASNVPARRIVGTNTLPNNALVQIEAIVGNAEGTPPFKK